MRNLISASKKAKRCLQRGSAWFLYYPYVWRLRLKKDTPRRLHVGCGDVRLPGWINADVHPSADLVIYMQRRLPFEDESLDRVFSEHVLEHVSFETGQFFLREAHRVLVPGGVLRIAMPDLEYLTRGYAEGNWRKFDWVHWPEFQFITTGAQMLNIAFRWWGHKHLYDEEELVRALRPLSFSHFERVQNEESSYDDLRGLESRPDSRLIMEAVK